MKGFNWLDKIMKDKKEFDNFKQLLIILIIGFILLVCVNFSINFGFFSCNYDPATKIKKLINGEETKK